MAACPAPSIGQTRSQLQGLYTAANDSLISQPMSHCPCAKCGAWQWVLWVCWDQSWSGYIVSYEKMRLIAIRVTSDGITTQAEALPGYDPALEPPVTATPYGQ